ncbi:hypothetical protein SNOG_03945 [Parastagonospora nodorum SN15]|uniref:NAD(P)-binding protein n=1 Tax=Phaeosphaeria nodorum (strain SN15 / ATCC MYA-4574 / FGSC 10173) TaxID=321614 RepID=Q0UWB9_PHANO|nr:hypothetical protein SNOG_03945 [Parastagonospora nodorum SN15]EAT89150.2 hypothetical protein SNOG_03945 [Parastagonospora nodorum SN15]
MAHSQRPRMQSSGISTLNLNKTARPGLERAPTSTNLTRPLPIHRLDGKVAFITGGGGKVGVETAGRLLIEGANVALIDINQQSLEVAVPVLRAAIPTGVPLESRLLTIAADATNESDVEACVKKTVQRFGRLDCALLNAGERDDSKSLFDTTAEDFESIMTTNARSGLRGFPGLISYSSSKFALRGIALTAAEELGEFDIRVNTIHTSIIDSGPGFKEGWTQERLDELKGETALGRFGRPDDVANVVAFLASEDSKFMTGGKTFFT